MTCSQMRGFLRNLSSFARCVMRKEIDLSNLFVGKIWLDCSTSALELRFTSNNEGILMVDSVVIRVISLLRPLNPKSWLCLCQKHPKKRLLRQNNSWIWFFKEVKRCTHWGFDQEAFVGKYLVVSFGKLQRICRVVLFDASSMGWGIFGI